MIENSELEKMIVAKIHEGMEAADRGDVVPHDQVVAELEAIMAAHRQRLEGRLGQKLG